MIASEFRLANASFLPSDGDLRVPNPKVDPGWEFLGTSTAEGRY